MIYVPAGDYTISGKIRIRADDSGLFGPGRIIQTTPAQPIIEIERAAGVRIRDLTLSRPAGTWDGGNEAVLAIQCKDLVLADLQVLENRTPSAAISLRECVGAQVRGCRILNYMCISVDDRTAKTLYGYAFKCIDGTGIGVTASQAIMIQGNRIVEQQLFPTPEIQQKHGLGKFVKKNAEKGLLINQETWNREYVSNWHQGSAIAVTSPMATEGVQILGNHIENAAQGIDLHCDRVIVSQNMIHNAFIGMKAMHGSRNVLIIGNQFSRNDLWAIGLMPGASSHAAAPAHDGQPATVANVDGGSIIANNIISDFGYGHAHWVWGDAGSPIKFDTGQTADNPPLRDVIIQGNIVYDVGRDSILLDGKPQTAPPRYRYAVVVARDAQGLHFSNNLLHPGTKGISNIVLKP